jgi:oligopeptide transport system substrate-binding protein
MFSALTDIDDDTKEAVPAMVTNWEANAEKTLWTFTIREDVPWVRFNPATGEVEVVLDESGEPQMVTAGDFVYGIKRTCDPRVASQYSWLLYVIQGCEELVNADPDTDDFQAAYDGVGVQALDDHTVEFTLNYGAGYFPQLASMSNLSPGYAPVIEELGERWIEPGFIVTNGPYALEKWVHGDHLVLVKNPHWPLWGTHYAPGNIERWMAYMIEEVSTEFAMYENDELDTAVVPLDQIQRVTSDPVLSQEFISAPTNVTYYYGFVTTKPPVDDPRVRKALSMAIDRVTLVEEVLKGGEIPANTFVNPLNFGHHAGDPDIAPWALSEDEGGTGYEAAVEIGQKLLGEAGYPQGEGLDLLLMHNVSEGHARIAQAVQAMWTKAYPEIRVSIETMEWMVYIDTISPDTDIRFVPHIYRLGWAADYPHASNWFEVLHPESGVNRMRLSDADPWVGDMVREYSEVIDAAQVADEDEADRLYKRAEQLLVDEIVGIAPMYYYTSTYVKKPWLEAPTYDPIKLHLFKWVLDVDAREAAK